MRSFSRPIFTLIFGPENAFSHKEKSRGFFFGSVRRASDSISRLNANGVKSSSRKKGIYLSEVFLCVHVSYQGKCCKLRKAHEVQKIDFFGFAGIFLGQNISI